MRNVRSRGNKATELMLVESLRSAGIRGWRRHAAIFGRPDFIFPAQRVALFVDGCFWHGCKKHCRMPSSNQEYWNAKIARNVVRDRTTTRRLRALGWRVVRIWEHELKSNGGRAIARIQKALTRKSLA
jgi:DNA mismatch endonuclease (patch repair protein)